MKYGNTRTSTRDKQDDDLQRPALIAAGVDERSIYTDEVTGPGPRAEPDGAISTDASESLTSC